MGRVLILDSNNIVIRSVLGREYSSDTRGENTSGILGFLQSSKALIQKFNPTSVVAVWDSGRSAKRRSILPTYKEREKKDEQQERVFDDAHRQMRELYELLKWLPIIQLRDAIIPTEADDLISAFSFLVNDEVIIVSTDRDFLQLVSDRIKVYSPAKSILIDKDNFLGTTGIERHLFLEYCILKGDKSDGIDGVTGVGEITARNLLRRYGNIWNILYDKATLEKTARLKNLVKEEHKLERNRSLMDLRLSAEEFKDRTKELLAEYKAPSKVMEVHWNTACIEYKFTSILLDIQEWNNTFNSLSNEIGVVDAPSGEEKGTIKCSN